MEQIPFLGIVTLIQMIGMDEANAIGKEDLFCMIEQLNCEIQEEMDESTDN